MSEHGFKPLSLFLIPRRALWSVCKFRALFEISGSYELGATLWGTEQYNKWAPLKTDHCSQALFVLPDTDFAGVFGGGWEWPTSNMPCPRVLHVQPETGREDREARPLISLKNRPQSFWYPSDTNMWDKPFHTQAPWFETKPKLPFISMYLWVHAGRKDQQ